MKFGSSSIFFINVILYIFKIKYLIYLLINVCKPTWVYFKNGLPQKKYISSHIPYDIISFYITWNKIDSIPTKQYRFENCLKQCLIL